MLAAKALAIWLVILCGAIANGALRETVLIPHLGRTNGLLLSGGLLAAWVLAIAYLSLPWLGMRRPRQLIGVGLGWLMLTLVFEFSIAQVQGKPWSSFLEAYTFKDGNLWPLLVLLIVVAAPSFAARLRRRSCTAEAIVKPSSRTTNGDS